MSAEVTVIEDYLEEMLFAAGDGRSLRARQYAERILGNYQASLNETSTYHRYFTDLRDGKGGWAEETARLRTQVRVLGEELTRVQHERDDYRADVERMT